MCKTEGWRGSKRRRKQVVNEEVKITGSLKCSRAEKNLKVYLLCVLEELHHLPHVSEMKKSHHSHTEVAFHRQLRMQDMQTGYDRYCNKYSQDYVNMGMFAY